MTSKNFQQYGKSGNPFFTYLFFALGFALLGLELFAIGPGLMAFIGALLIGFSSITFTEFGLNYYGLILFLISFAVFWVSIIMPLTPVSDIAFGFQ